jgi:hypothetical protein
MARTVGLCVLFSCISIAALPLAAQEVADLVTDRPDQTESAVVVPEGDFQGEFGAAFARDEARGEAVEVLGGPGTLLRYGVAERFELRLAWAGVLELETKGAGRRERQSGAADPELGFKLSLLSPERGDGWRLALLVHASVPVGDDELGSPRADPSLRLLGAHDLREGIGLGWNVGYETGSFESGGTRHTLGRFVYTGSVGYELAPRWGAFVELFGDLPGSDPDPAAHSFDAGVTFLLTDLLQLDVAAGLGLNDAAEDWFVGAGVSFRKPLRR